MHFKKGKENKKAVMSDILVPALWFHNSNWGKMAEDEIRWDKRNRFCEGHRVPGQRQEKVLGFKVSKRRSGVLVRERRRCGVFVIWRRRVLFAQGWLSKVGKRVVAISLPELPGLLVTMFGFAASTVWCWCKKYSGRQQCHHHRHTPHLH